MSFHYTLVKNKLQSLQNPEKAKFFPRFFKTGKGEYGEGDKFIGVTVPNCRLVAREFKNLSFPDIAKLLQSSIHEERCVALMILTTRFKKTDEKQKKELYDFYIKYHQYVNNWDLVDSSADKIVGVYLSDKPRDLLYQYARSGNLWERRIAIISTFHFIRNNDFVDTLKIAEILLKDRQDLIHKAVGWMLREVGKRDLGVLEKFLNIHKNDMPRIMLRYAIEKFPEGKRKRYLEK